MEDLNALYTALEQADAAGDKESAQQLADYIRSLPTEEPTEEAPVDATQVQKDLTKPVESFQGVAPQPGSASVADAIKKPIESVVGKFDEAPHPTLGSAAKGAINVKDSITNMQLAELIQLMEAKKSMYGPNFEKAPPNELAVINQTKSDITKLLNESAQHAADRLAIEEKYGADPLSKKLDKLESSPEYQKAGKLEKFKMFGHELVSDPSKIPGYIGHIGLESLPSSLAMIATAAVTKYLTGSSTAAAMTGGATSNFMEFGQEYVNLRRQGYSNDDAVAMAATKANIIGYFDAVSFGSAGKALDNIMKEAEKTIGKKVINTAKEVTKETGKQAFYGAAGEGVGSVASGQPVDLRSVTEEALGEIAGAPFEAVTTFRDKTAQQKQQEKEPIEVTLGAPKTDEGIPPSDQKRPSRETLKRQFMKSAEDEANEINRVKQEKADQLKAAQNQQLISEAADLETAAPINPMEVTDTTLTSWGLKKNSKAYKKLIGKDMSLPDNRALLDEALEEHPGKINEQAVDTYKTLLDQQKVETPYAGFDLGTTRISDEVLGGQKYGTPSGTPGRYGPTTDISGGPFGIDQTREGTGDVTLKEPKTLPTGERFLSIQELLNDPNPQQRRAARRKFIDMFQTEQANELIKEEAKVERKEREKFAKLKKTQYPIVDQSTNLANILSTLKDKPNYLIEDLRNKDVTDAERNELNQHARDYLLAESLRNKYKVRMTPEEVAALEKEGETVTQKEKPLSEDEFKDLQDEFLARQAKEEGPLEARAKLENIPEGLHPELAEKMIKLEKADRADNQWRTGNTQRSQTMLSRSILNSVRKLYPGQTEWKVLGDLNSKYGDWVKEQADKTQEARGQIQETGETPESIEQAFQKQYGKNVGLAKRRGLLQFLKDASELPPEIGKVSPTTKAVYHKGVGYFITNRITKEDAPRMLLHEIGVHYGLEGMLGTNNYKRVVKQIKQRHLTDKELKAAWDNTVQTYPEYAEGSDNFMQEVIANIGETAPNNTIWRQIVGYIKQFLSKLGYGWDINKITADDIRDMVQHSVRMSLAGKIKQSSTGVALSSEETGAPKPTYYSQLSRVITNAQFKNNVSTQSGEQWVNWLNSKTSEAGVKRDELEFSGLLEFLDRNKSEKFNKQDILNYLKQNGTKVNEYMYGEGEGNSYSDKEKEEWVEQGVSEWVEFQEEGLALKVNEQAADTYEFPYYVKEEEVLDAEGNKLWRIYFEGQRTAVEDTYYSSEDEAQAVADEYNNQGINDYSELLYERYLNDIYNQANDVRDELEEQWDYDHENVRTKYLDWTLEGGDKKYTEVVIALEDPREKVLFSHDHWRDLSNPIAHYRVNSRIDAKGNIVLFVEEIQSDWAQAPKRLRKKHITELAEKWKIDNNSPLPLDTIKQQIAKFVPGDWGFQRKVTPEQQKEYDEILTKLKDFREAKAELSNQIYKFSEFEKRLFDYIDYEARKILYSKIASNTNISEDLTPEERVEARNSLMSRHKHEFDLTRRAYLKRVLNQDVSSGYSINGFTIDENIIKEILNQPGVKENIAQYEKNKPAQDKAIYQEDQLYDKIKDLESKQKALSQTGKIVRGPFVEDTEAWSNLVLKNIIRFAAERGYDKVAFVNGKQAAFKGGKAEYIDEVFGTRNKDGTFDIYATLKGGGGRARTLKNIRDIDLEDYVGGLADKMRSLEVGETDGWDAGELKLPSRGMVEFYDNMILRYAAKLIKKLGGTQLETIELIPPNQDRPEDEKVGKQKGFTITSVMKEKAMAGQTLFARASKQELDEDLKKSGTVGKVDKGFPTLKERFAEEPLKTTDELIADFRKNFFSFDAAINNKILIAMRKQGISDKAIADMIHEARVSQAVKADQIADMWMVHGGIKYDPISFSFVIQDLGNSMSTIRETLKTLSKKYGVSEYEMYQYGNAAFVSARSQDLTRANANLYRRVRKLFADGKTAQAKKEADKYKLVHQTPAEIKRGLKFFNTIPELKKLKKVWNINRARLMKVAVDNGLYTKEQARDLLDIIDYVPFFRDKQVEQGKAVRESTRGLLDVATQKHLKGSYQPVHNVFDNMELWARYTLKKSINNKAAQEKIKYYSTYIPDDIKILKSGRSTTGNVVGVWQNGKVVKYEFQGYDGESMVDGFTGMEPATMAPGAAFTRPFNNFIRAQVVLEPLFNLAQIPMDMFNAMFASGVNISIMVPLQVVKEIVYTPLGISSARKYLTARGITGKHDFNSEYDRIDIEGMKEVKEATKAGKLIEYVLAPPKALIKGFKFLGMVSDNIIRQAVYSQIMLETGDQARATYAADEIINFRRTGSSATINLVRQNAVFVNANLQAMNISYGTIMLSDITNDHKLIQLRRLLLNGAQVIMAGLAIAALNADDDDYKKLDPKDRDNYIMIPGTGGYRLPLRGDILTFLFKVVPEHLYNRYIEESEDSTKMRKALSVAFQRALSMPSALPSYLTFFIEQSLNFDFVTGRPLRGRSQEDLEAELQYSNKYTSQFARAVTDLTKDTPFEVSPISVQHFMNRWLASTSMLVGLFTNSIIASIRGEILPAKTIREKLLQIPNMSKFLSKEENTRNINDFYELTQLVDAAVQSANKYKNLDYDKFVEFQNKDNKAALIDLRKELATISRDLQNLREWENKVIASKDRGQWTPQTKKVELDRIEAARQNILGHQQQVQDGIDRRIQNLRKQGGL